MRRIVPSLVTIALCAPALAITGDAPPAQGYAAHAIVMIVDPRGDLCTGTALARDLVLTAAHCVAADTHIKIFQTGQTVTVRGIARHPQFNPAAYAASRATADVALIKLATPLSNLVVPAKLAQARRVAVGETLTIAGFGVTVARTDRGLGVPRMATLIVTGKPGALQIRLFDVATHNLRAGLGACTGDSGGPAFEPASQAVIGVVSWTTAPANEEGCGGLTGVTPLLLYRDWIAETAIKFGDHLQ